MKTNWEALAEKLVEALRKLLDAHIYAPDRERVDAAYRQADRAVAAYDAAVMTTEEAQT